MIPPEPDPPTPTVPEYTYALSSPVTLGAVTGTLYTAIQQNGVDCELKTTDDDSHVRHYPNIILYDDVLGDHQCYFARGTSPIIGVLGSNSAIGTEVPVYTIQNGTVTQQTTEYIDSSIPSDYYSNIKSRNFTLAQR